MAWRPTQYLIEGELDNTTPGRITGWMRFAGLIEKVTFDLKGDFHRDIRGTKTRLRGRGGENDPDAEQYMDGLALHQTGKAGDITAGRQPCDYVSHPYIEWYGDENGRAVIEPDADQIEVMGTPIPACESDPISREQQRQNMMEYLADLSTELGVAAFSSDQLFRNDEAKHNRF